MTNFRIIAALTVITGAFVVAAMPTALAQTLRPTPAAVAPVAQINQGFARCPRSADMYVEVVKQLVGSVARARALADENPLLEPDAAFYEAELAATKKCVPTVASLTR
jgi:hypothetical protein